MADTKHKDVEMKDADVDEDEVVEQKDRDELMDIAEWKFLLTLSDDLYSDLHKQDSKDNIMDKIEEHNRAPMYKNFCQDFGWDFDQSLYDKMVAENDKKLKELADKIEEAKEKEGETEVVEAHRARAKYFDLIGDKDRALKAFAEVMEMTVGAGGKIDLVLNLIRIGLFHGDMTLVKDSIERAKTLVDKGGDWERRNLLKVYEGTYLVMIREFKKAALLFLDSIATFTCYELYSYNTLLFYTVVSSLVSLDRPTIRDKLVKSPEILSAQRELPTVHRLLQSLYKCKYSDYFVALTDISDDMKRDQFFSAHFGYWFREMRIVAYKQFLQSYRSVTLESMASSFGISVPFLDRELSRFIAGGRLNCKIDKVKNIVETNRPDAKNAQYQSTLKQGDLLLSRIQKLTKVVSY